MAAFHVQLRALQPARFTKEPSRAMQAAMFRAMEAIDAPATRAIHEAQNKPFTLSPLWHSQPRRQPAYTVRADEPIWLRIAALERGALDLLLAALSTHWREERPLVLDWHPFSIDAIEPAEISPLVAPTPLITYANLREMTPPSEEIGLRFVSPAVIRQHSIELPPTDPWHVFGGFLRRWNAYAGTRLPGIDESSVHAGVTLARVERLKRAGFHLGFEQSAGYLGEVRYQVGGDAVFRHGIAVLATYALLCGTGARTALGMGQTERIR